MIKIKRADLWACFKHKSALDKKSPYRKEGIDGLDALVAIFFSIISMVKEALPKLQHDLSQTISGGTNELRFIDLLRGIASVVIIVSLLSFKYIERPAQKKILNHCL